MPVSPTVTLSASEAGAVAMSIEMKLRCNARIFKLWSGKGGKVELKERAILDEPGTRRFCFDRQLEVPIYSLLRCYQQDKVSNPVNEKKVSSSLSLSNDTDCPGILFSSIAHSPKSINLQRSEQNGLDCCSATQGTEHPQFGHFTMSGLWDDDIRKGSRLRKKECHQGFASAACYRKTAS